MKLSSWPIFILLVIPSLKMYAAQQIPWLDNSLDVLGMFSCIILIMLCCLRRKKLVFPKGCKYFIIFFFLYLFSTILHYGENLLGLVSEVSKILIVVLFLILSFSSGERVFLNTLKKFRKTYMFILFIDSVCLLIEILGFRIYESDIYTILGLDNYAAFSILPMLSLIFYTSYKTKDRITATDKLIFVFCLLAKMITFSFAAILAMTVMALTTYIALCSRQLRKIISVRFIACIIVCFLLGLTFFKLDTKMDVFLAPTGKSIVNRTELWRHALQGVSKSPFIGHGALQGDQYKTIAGYYLAYTTTETHPHNYILEILISTGIVGLLIYIGIINQMIKAIRNNIKEKKMAIALGDVTGFLVLSIPDGYFMLPAIYAFMTVVFLDNIRFYESLNRK